MDSQKKPTTMRLLRRKKVKPKLDSQYTYKRKKIEKRVVGKGKDLLKYNRSRMGSNQSQVHSEASQQQRLQSFYSETLSKIFGSQGVTALDKKILEELASSEPISVQKLFSLKDSPSLWNSNSEEGDILSFYSLIKMISSSRCDYYLLRRSEEEFLIKVRMEGRKYGKQFTMLRMSKEDREMVQKHDSFMERIGNQERKYEEGSKQTAKMSELAKQMSFLFNLQVKNEKQIAVWASSLCEKISLEAETNKREQIDPRVAYTKELILKNLQIGFLDQAIDQLNYFRRREFIQEQNQPYFVPLENHRQLHQYLAKRRPTCTKPVRAFLPTACTACLSNHYQKYNPILVCTNCHTRRHKLCDPLLPNYCQYCHQKRSKSPSSCLICSYSGLIIRNITQNNQKNPVFIHTFCMFVHKLWKVTENCNVECDIGKLSIQKQNTKNPECRICQKKMLFHFSCKHCMKKFHATCAYFSGYQISLVRLKDKNCKESLPEFQIQMNCCNDLKEKMEYRRKYKLNYENMAVEECRKSEENSSGRDERSQLVESSEIGKTIGREKEQRQINLQRKVELAMEDKEWAGQVNE